MNGPTFWCGRCNRNKPECEFVRRRGGSAICRSCEKDRVEAMKRVREQAEAIRRMG